MVADFAPVARSGKSPGAARTFLQRPFRIPAVLLGAALYRLENRLRFGGANVEIIFVLPK